MGNFNFIKNHFIVYPTPLNISYFFSLGFLAGIVLVFQIITGLFISFYYSNDINFAFNSIEFFMRNIEYGWLFRYLHSNGASFFFIIIYLHIFKGLYYKSFLYPRHLVWFSGLFIFILLMATAFLGYILPWGQMSFWGATVITNLLSVLPYIGDSLVLWLWGGFSISNPTLMRFFILHFILPFIILAFICIHLSFIHFSGSYNILMFNKINNNISFYPFFFFKDFLSFLILSFIIFIFICYDSNFFNHSDNYIKSNPLITPLHIVPEWYFLPFYAILRSIDNKTIGVFFMFFSIFILFLFPFFSFKFNFFFKNFSFISFYIKFYLKKNIIFINYFFDNSFKFENLKLKTLYIIFIWFYFILFILLGWLGQLSITFFTLIFGKILTFFFFFIIFILFFLI